jgi:ABC-type multidrug transport system fused ATPase/permease subunit
VLVGETGVDQADPAALSRHVTMVAAGAHVFSGTVRENLLMARPEATDEQLWAALKTARLDGFVRERGGLDMAIEQDAANLSGGQRQRLALARALLHDSPVYVFDEATSNIDAESEEQVMAAVRELARERAVLVISHRLANVVDASCIYVLRDGRVVGAGTHGELLANCEEYGRLWGEQQALEAYGRGERHGA